MIVITCAAFGGDAVRTLPEPEALEWIDVLIANKVKFSVRYE